MRNVPHMAAASLIVAKHHNTHCLAPNEERPSLPEMRNE
jgi:hypothetical protein